MSSLDSTIRIPSSSRCFSNQSVSTKASGWAYCVGWVAIRLECRSAFYASKEFWPRKITTIDNRSSHRDVVWQSRRGEQLRELTPSLLLLFFGAAALFDVIAHHIFAKVIIDDVAPVLLDEIDLFRRPLLIHQRVLLQPHGSCRGIDLTIKIFPSCFVYRVIEFFYQVLHGIKFFCPRWVNPCGRPEHFLFECQTLRCREHDFFAKVRRSFGDE